MENLNPDIGVMRPDQAFDLIARSTESIAKSLEKLTNPVITVQAEAGEPPDHDWDDHGICKRCSYARYSCPDFPFDNAPPPRDIVAEIRADDEIRTITELEGKLETASREIARAMINLGAVGDRPEAIEDAIVILGGVRESLEGTPPEASEQCNIKACKSPRVRGWLQCLAHARADERRRLFGEEGRLEASELFPASPCPLLTETIARIAEVTQLTLAGEGMRKAYVWIGDIAQAAKRSDAVVVHRLIAESKRRGS